MRKTSIYLEEADRARLRRLAEQQGRSQADVVRAAIAEYAEQHIPSRKFAMAGSFDGDGTSMADIPEEDLLRGFGAEDDN
jgi:hypothetical protein